MIPNLNKKWPTFISNLTKKWPKFDRKNDQNPSNSDVIFGVGTWRRTEAMRNDPTITSIMGLTQTDATWQRSSMVSSKWRWLLRFNILSWATKMKPAVAISISITNNTPPTLYSILCKFIQKIIKLRIFQDFFGTNLRHRGTRKTPPQMPTSDERKATNPAAMLT